MNIRNKAQFFELWEAGVLGNRTNLWHNAQDAYKSGAPNIGFREIGKTGGGAWCKVPREQVFLEAMTWTQMGRKFIMDDGAPDQYRTLQGEICRTHKGMEGFLEIGGKLPMRKAIAAGLMKHCSYMQCMDLLNRYMDPSSRDDVDMIFELYPGSAIEFSCFSVNVGVFPHRNTLFWEVRNY